MSDAIRTWFAPIVSAEAATVAETRKLVREADHISILVRTGNDPITSLSISRHSALKALSGKRDTDPLRSCLEITGHAPGWLYIGSFT